MSVNEAHAALVETLDERVRVQVRREGVDPQRDPSGGKCKLPLFETCVGDRRRQLGEDPAGRSARPSR